MTKDHYHIGRYSSSFRPAARAAGTGACLLTKIGVDAAENEPLNVHLIFKLWDLIFTEPPRPASIEGARGATTATARLGHHEAQFGRLRHEVTLACGVSLRRPWDGPFEIAQKAPANSTLPRSRINGRLAGYKCSWKIQVAQSLPPSTLKIFAVWLFPC